MLFCHNTHTALSDEQTNQVITCRSRFPTRKCAFPMGQSEECILKADKGLVTKT